MTCQVLRNGNDIFVAGQPDTLYVGNSPAFFFRNLITIASISYVNGSVSSIYANNRYCIWEKHQPNDTRHQEAIISDNLEEALNQFTANQADLQARLYIGHEEFLRDPDLDKELAERVWVSSQGGALYHDVISLAIDRKLFDREFFKKLRCVESVHTTARGNLSVRAWVRSDEFMRFMGDTLDNPKVNEVKLSLPDVDLADRSGFGEFLGWIMAEPKLSAEFLVSIIAGNKTSGFRDMVLRRETGGNCGDK